jgi:O-antigen ligase
VPLCAGVVALLVSQRPRIGRGPNALLDWALVACLAGVSAQLVPLPASLWERISPHALEVDRALRLDATTQALAAHPLSLDPAATAWALALGAAYVGLFWCARTIFAGGGVRLTTRGISWLGVGLTMLVAVQRATSPKLLYWTWRPLNAGASPYGPFVNRNGLACWLALAILLIVGYAVARQQSRPAGGVSSSSIDSTQLWLGGAAVLMTGGLLGSLSRAGIFGAAIGLLAFVLLSRARLSRGSGLVWIVAGLLAMVAAATVYANLGALALRMQETTELGEWGRRAIWRDTWRMASDFRWTGVGAGAFQRGMLVYQQASRLFFFNHAHDEYLQLLAEGGVLLAVPSAIALLAGIVGMASHLRADGSAIFWIRAGAITAMVAAAVQSVWDTALRTPANGVLFAVIAAIALHDPRVTSPTAPSHGSSSRKRSRHSTGGS